MDIFYTEKNFLSGYQVNLAKLKLIIIFKILFFYHEEHEVLEGFTSLSSCPSW